MKYLRHQTTAPDTWAYDPATRTVSARFSDQLIEIPVCTEKHPRNGAWFIARKDSEMWTISPVWCVATSAGFAARNCAFDVAGVHCDFIYLIGAPEKISDMMSDLYEPVPEPGQEEITVRLCPKCDATGTIEGIVCSLCDGHCAISIAEGLAWDSTCHD